MYVFITFFSVGKQVQTNKNQLYKFYSILARHNLFAKNMLEMFTFELFKNRRFK